MSRTLQEPLPRSLHQLLEQIAQLANVQQKQGFEYTPIGMRESLDTMTRRFVTQAPEVPFIRDTLVQGTGNDGYPVPVRIYHPKPDQPLPVLIFAHGGGHMAGSVSLYHLIARKLAVSSQRVLVSVEYRLSPECPYPSALTDLENVIAQVFPTLEHLGISHRRQLAVAGDSGGGAIAASATHRIADDRGVQIDELLLMYPSLDYTMASESMDTLGVGYLLERDRIGWLFEQYLQHNEDRRQVSPRYMDLPQRFPRTMVMTAGYCPLRDEGLAYVNRLAEAGIDVESLHFPNMIHAFLNLEELVPRESGEFYRAAGEFLREV